MLHAVLNGKSAGTMEREDIFTSTVLGVLALPEHYDLLLEFIGMARVPNSVDDGRWPPKGAKVMNVDFWPWLKKSRVEPDLRIDLTDSDGESHAVFIEAKLNSGLSGKENQLAQQWNAIREEGILNCTIIYLTRHFTCPVEDINGAKANEPDCSIRWLSWRSVYTCLKSKSSNEQIELLMKALVKVDMTFFEGWPEVVVGTAEWNFTPKQQQGAKS